MPPKVFRKRVLICVLGGILFLWAYFFRYEVPVLMYHHVGNPAAPGSLNVSTKTFERQMEFLRLHGYRTVTVTELARMIKSGRSVPPKTVAITFDDGYLNNFTEAFPILKKLGLKATIFMITDNIDRADSLSAEDLRILDESGIEIGSHTAHHAFMPKLSLEEVRQELSVSKARLEKVLGHPVTSFSYPAGGVTRQVRQAVAEAGYEGAVTTNYGQTKHDPYALRRVKISDAKGNLFNFWVKLSGFYLTGKRKIEIA